MTLLGTRQFLVQVATNLDDAVNEDTTVMQIRKLAEARRLVLQAALLIESVLAEHRALVKL
jgi:hypothetical protein